MSYRRRHRWFRRMALGLAFASVMFAGRVSVAAAKFDEGTNGSRYVAAGGWSGVVDMESGIPLSAGIPDGDEPFVGPQAVQVIPYLSGGILTEADAQAAASQAIHDPYLTDVFVRPGESLGGPDGQSLGGPNGEEIAFANAVVAAAGSLHDPLTAQEQGLVVGPRPDDKAVRFAHSDVASQPELSSGGGSTVEWNEALTVGIGALVLVLGLGLAVGYLRRPRLAGP
ncbi:MAG TPA: hypothetical protein VNP89_03415 [Gaiellaceae bacterium]|nr:hypothetical protein [Gaiellaceae bacterium]